MADWSPPEHLQSTVVHIITRAADEAQSALKREVRDRTAGRGFTANGVNKITREATATAILLFGSRATCEILELLSKVYRLQVPIEALAWVQAELSRRIESLGQSYIFTLEKSEEMPSPRDAYTSKAARVVNDAVQGSVRDLTIALAPLMIRAEQGIPEDALKEHPTIYNVTGPNARVNVSSTDSSTNIVNVDSKQLFASMRDAAGQVEEPDRAELLTRINEMEAAAPDKESLGRKYAAFIQVAANYMAVFQPSFTALGQMLGGG